MNFKDIYREWLPDGYRLCSASELRSAMTWHKASAQQLSKKTFFLNDVSEGDMISFVLVEHEEKDEHEQCGTRQYVTVRLIREDEVEELANEYMVMKRVDGDILRVRKLEVMDYTWRLTSLKNK